MKQSTLIMVVIGVVILGVVGYMVMNMSKDTKMTSVETTPAATETADTTMSDKTIVEVAKEAGTFNTLLAAAEAAGLVETLSGPGPYTVFAPTDDAFAKLPAGTVEGLLQDKAALAKILTYHVVAGKVPASEVVTMTSAKTVEGSDVTIKTEGSTVMVNNATVTATDIQASNGIIHVIDTVLMPQ